MTVTFPYLIAPLQPPIANEDTRSLAAWVFDNWRNWKRSDADGERPLNVDELVAIRAAVEKIAWHGARVH
jgi:hypothetical protein